MLLLLLLLLGCAKRVCEGWVLSGVSFLRRGWAMRNGGDVRMIRIRALGCTPMGTHFLPA